MNIFCFTGNLGNDCEVKHTTGGTAVCNFSVAVSSGYGVNKQTNWVRCALFGKRAEGGLIQYLIKGQQVAVSGECSLRTWEKDGKTGASLEVNVNDLTLVGAASRPQDQSEAQPAAQPASTGNDFVDSDIPF